MPDKTQWPERGDTLIEVVMALTILSAVLTSGYVMANRAYISGQTAKERSELVSQAQQQAEALKIFRDETNWHDFELGNTVKNFDGVNIRLASGDCNGIAPGYQHCFHMELKPLSDGTVHWVPLPNGTDVTGTLGRTAIVVNGLFGPEATKFVVRYGIDPIGDPTPRYSGQLRVNLQNLAGITP